MSAQETPNDLSGVTSTFVIQLAITTGLLILFSLVRPRNKRIYEPKVKFAQTDKRPMPIGDGFFSWIKVVFRLDEYEYAARIGLDAVFFLRLLNFCFKLFIATTTIGIPLCILHYLAPQYLDTRRTSSDPSFSGFTAINPKLNTLTIVNMPSGSDWFYLHVGIVWLFSLYAYYLLYRTWLNYIHLRRKWFSSQEFATQLHNRTLLLTNLPNELQNAQAILNYFGSRIIYPVQKVIIGRDFKKLPTYVKEYDETLIKLESVLAKYLKDPLKIPNKRPSHYEAVSWCSFKEKDSIDCYKRRLDELESEIYSHRIMAEEAYDVDRSAFVIFGSIRDAQATALKMEDKNTLLLRGLTGPVIKLSPPFKDLIWENIGLNQIVRKSRSLIASSLFLGLTVGWTFLLSTVTLIANLDTIGQVSPDLRNFVRRWEVASVFVQFYLGPLLLVVLNILLPIILRQIVRFQGVNSILGVEKATLYKFFAFQVYQVFFLVALSPLLSISTALLSGKPINDGKESAYETLFKLAATGIVKNASFYITYLVPGFTGYAIEIVQGVPLFMNFIKRKFFTLTPRQEREIDKPPVFEFTTTYGLLLVSTLVAFSYSVIAPLISPFALILFFLAYMVMKYQLFYVYETRVESGGTWWPKIFNMVCVIIGFAQLATLTAIVMLSTLRSGKIHGKIQAIFLAILPVMTFMFWLYGRRVLGLEGRYAIRIPNQGVLEYRFMPDLVLEQSAYNPALTQSLKKLWVRNERLGMQYYTPRYRDIREYTYGRDIDIE